MNNTKTTIAGIVAAAAFVLGRIFKLDIPPEVTDGVLAIAVFAMGLFAKDAKKEN